MNAKAYADLLLPAIEEELRRIVSAHFEPEYADLHGMLAYHMGWEGQGAGPSAQGKRLRPFLLLLAAIAAGNNWQDYLPLAAAVELVHNFSLIHDDIEDNSPLRRGRDTLWIRRGIPQAINCGDLMFTIAHRAVFENRAVLGEKAASEASRLLLDTCVQLTQGQYLDIDFEQRTHVTVDDYLRMIRGKTAALFGCCFELGAIASQPAIRKSMRDYGISLGLAFQIQDDMLGLWGDSRQTGKSTESDLVSGKKTLPILYALQHNAAFRERWNKGSISAAEAKDISAQLMQDGTWAYVKSIAERYTAEAAVHLQDAQLDGNASAVIDETCAALLARDH